MKLIKKLPVVFACGFAIGLLAMASAEAGSISVDLERAIVDLPPGKLVDVIVKCSKKANISAIRDRNRRLRRTKIVRTYNRAAVACERLLSARLRAADGVNLRNLSLANGIAVRVPASRLNELATAPGVDKIILDRKIRVPTAIPAGIDGGSAIPEWNINTIRAPELWSAGFDGQGVVVATMDSGVDTYHSDLGPRQRPQDSWFDPHGQHATPHDANGHGTWVMGLLLGGDAGGTAIGVAPGAQWIAVKIFDDSGTALLSDIHAGFQWLLDPDGDPTTDDAPDIVNNSWYLDGTQDFCETEFTSDIAAMKAAEIAVVFSAGNTGPNPASSVSPPNYPQSGSVGATDFLDNVAYFSARGPSACDGGIFPDLVAPGASVYTADRTFGGLFPNSFLTVSGTSFASPHVSGAMALLKSGFSNATVSELESALTESAIDIGVAGDDDDSGAGRIDLVEAYNWLVANGETSQAGELSLSADTYSTDESVGTLTVTISRLNGSTGDVTVDFATQDGSAAAGEDYEAASGTLTLLDGETSATFSVTIIDDTISEGDEDFSVYLSNPGGAVLGTPDAATVTIFDDDLQPQPGTLQLDIASYGVDENGGSVTVTVSRVNGSDGAVTVDYATADETATAGGDYGATSGTLTLLDGETSGTFSITIIDDTISDGDETFSVNLANPAGGAMLGTPNAATVTIFDDDPPPQPGILQLGSLGNSSYSVDENGGSVTVTVSRVNGSDGTVTVDYATADGSATAGGDYGATSGTLTFGDGETSQSFAVTILDDAMFEGDETFSVTLSNPTGDAVLGSPNATTVTIVDDDSAGPIDVDSDGYASDVDCNDNDPSIYPGAPEIKHDGVDQDCNGYDLTIDITRALYKVSKDKLVIHATSDLGGQAGLSVIVTNANGGTVTSNLNWKANKSRWQKTISSYQSQYGSQPLSITVSGVEGSQSATVKIKP